MTSPSLDEIGAMEPEEIRAAINQLRRCDPVAFLEAIAAIVGRDHD